MPIVLGKKRKCPDCGALAFGSLRIGQKWGGQDYLELACEKCWSTYECDLPRLQKRILYLDQSAISLMMRDRQTGKDTRWSELLGRLKSMVQWQRLICPSSWEHRQESELSKDRYPRLMDTCRDLAMGDRLRGSWDVLDAQIYKALKAFMSGEEATWCFESRDAFKDDPNAWHDLLAIDVDFGRQPDQVADRRKSKMGVHADMESLYSDPKYLQGSFEEHVQRETEGFARGLTWAFDKQRRELLEMMCGQRLSDPLAFLSSPGAQAVQMVLMAIQQESQTDDLGTKAREFFFSPQFASVPVVRINAILRAAMALKARDSGRNPKPSDQCDVDVISSYLPYCDAMLIDGEMRSLATDGRARLGQDYGTRLFSARVLPRLHEWLEEVEISFPDHLKRAVSDVYEEHFDKLNLRKGRNLLEARKALFSMRPTTRPPMTRPKPSKKGREDHDDKERP